MRAQPSVKSGQTNPSVLTADPRCPPNGTIYFKQFLEGKFWFDAEGHLTNFIGTRRSHDEENAFASYILEHPEITRAEAITELKKRGAKFGPNDKAAFVQNLPISKLETFLGKLEILSVEIPIWSDYRPNPATWPDWTVIVRATRADGRQTLYELGFDQFNGELWDLETVDPTTSK